MWPVFRFRLHPTRDFSWALVNAGEWLRMSFPRKWCRRLQLSAVEWCREVSEEPRRAPSLARGCFSFSALRVERVSVFPKRIRSRVFLFFFSDVFQTGIVCHNHYTCNESGSFFCRSFWCGFSHKKGIFLYVIVKVI
jgi:hypothetical protein